MTLCLVDLIPDYFRPLYCETMKSSSILTIFALASATVATLPTQHVFNAPSLNCLVSSVPYQQRYAGVKYPNGKDVRLRISNGGGSVHSASAMCKNRVSTNVYCSSAGQAGLVGALASAYIDWSRQFGGVTEDYLVRLGILWRPYDKQVSIAPCSRSTGSLVIPLIVSTISELATQILQSPTMRQPNIKL
jgi:hypothetical protein